MRSPARLIRVWLLVAATILSTPTQAATIYNSGASAVTVTLNPGSNVSELLSLAREGGASPAPRVILNPSTLPFVDSHGLTSGDNSVTANYNLSDDSFDITFAHAIGSTFNDLAQRSVNIFFSINVNCGYALSGMYTAIDSEGRKKMLVNDCAQVNFTLNIASSMRAIQRHEDELRGGLT